MNEQTQRACASLSDRALGLASAATLDALQAAERGDKDEAIALADFSNVLIKLSQEIDR